MKIIRAILFILNVILALALVLTTLAGTLPPSRTLLPSVAAYAFLPLLAANVVFILIWILLRRWTWLFSAAVIALRWGMVGLFFQFGGLAKKPVAEDHPYMFTLLNYNVHQFHGPTDLTQNSDSIAREFLAMVDKYHPDLLCLQEYAKPKTLALNDSLVLKGYNHYYGAHTSRDGVPYGTVVYSKLPITYVSRIDNKKLMVELLKEQQKLRLCCVHMDSYRFDAADRQEIERMSHGEMQDTSRRWISKVKETILCHEKEWTQTLKPIVTESSLPLVLAGDFNDIPGSWLYWQVSNELRDCYCDRGLGMSITYNGGEDNPTSLRMRGLPQFRIDMVFRSEGINTLGYKRIKSSLSDHYPILVTLEIEN